MMDDRVVLLRQNRSPCAKQTGGKLPKICFAINMFLTEKWFRITANQIASVARKSYLPPASSNQTETTSWLATLVSA